MTRIPPHRWLALIPPACLLAGVPLADRIHVYVFGLPFLLAWIVGCVLLTSLVMAVVRALDARDRGAPRPPAGPAPPDAPPR